ncbi:IPT/TIG domain-containing protein [Chloroflexota bacterium]
MKYINIFRALAIALILALLAATVPATPVLAANIDIYPDEGEIGDNIDIFGLGFAITGSVYVYFSSDDVDVNDQIDDEVTIYERVVTINTDDAGEFDDYFTVPDILNDGATSETVHGGTYYVYVTTATSKNIRARAEFTVETVGVIALNPVEGTVGSQASVSGTGFAASKSVTITFDGTQVAAATTDSAGNFPNTTFNVPASYRGSHIIEAKDSSNNADTKTFTTKQSMTSSPTSGVAGETISVSGTGFAATSSLTINFDSAAVTSATTSSVGSFTATLTALPRGAGGYEIQVVDGSGNSATATFTIAASTISLNPASGYPGIQLTVSGTGFLASKPATIVFDNEIAATTSTDQTGKVEATITVPVVSTGTYVVKITDGTNTAEASFSSSTTTTISPATSTSAPGHIGTELTVSGAGFIAGKSVNVTYDGTQIDTTTVNTDGTFSATFKAPVGKGGQHTIVITDGTTTEQFTFTMESTPPAIPARLKPEMGIKAEQPVYFDWEDVTDPSGVTYTLQIATDEDFTEESIVLEKTELTESKYTVPEEEKLVSVSEENPYYWHVKAVDGASNESEWTGTGSFYVGGFSWGIPQGLSYTLIIIGALMFGIFAFWLGRKTAYY